MAHFESLPAEVALQILTYVAIPDLLSLSRTSRRLRRLALDPVLHTQRLHSASRDLERYLPRRPSLESLRPPRRCIYLTRTHVLARSISRSLITIRLNRNLAQRPAPVELVCRGILPPECTSYNSPVSPALFSKRQRFLRERVRTLLGRKLRHRPSVTSLVELNILPEECARKGGNVVAPGLVQRRRRVIRERLKDGLRAWVERRAVLMRKQKEEEAAAAAAAAAEAAEVNEKERLGVKALVKTFSSRILDEHDEQLLRGGNTAGLAAGLSTQKKAPHAAKLWGDLDAVARQRQDRTSGLRLLYTQGGHDGGCSQPTRAHVLGLRRFWEGVIKAATG